MTAYGVGRSTGAGAVLALIAVWLVWAGSARWRNPEAIPEVIPEFSGYDPELPAAVARRRTRIVRGVVVTLISLAAAALLGGLVRVATI